MRLTCSTTFSGVEGGQKIKRDVMISDYKNGGLRMINIKSFNKALKATWVKKYFDNENHGKWKLLFDSEISDLGGEMLSLKVISTKMIWQSLYIYQTPLQQKF